MCQSTSPRIRSSRMRFGTSSPRESVLALLDRELARFGFSRSDILSDDAHAAHWSDPLADPADIACHHTLSATNDALNTAFTLLPDTERTLLRESLGSKWFRYRVRVPLSRWRQLRAMQADGRLVIHGGVDARDAGLDELLADLGADRVIPALGQSSNLWEGPSNWLPTLPRRVSSTMTMRAEGLVDPATGRALAPEAGRATISCWSARRLRAATSPCPRSMLLPDKPVVLRRRSPMPSPPRTSLRVRRQERQRLT